MESARISVQANTVPIEDAVGGVGVLLDFENDEARADGMDAPAGQEHGVAGFDLNPMEAVSDGSGLDLLRELVASDTAFQADIKLGPGRGIGDVPHLGFGFAAEFGGLFRWRMDLEGELFLGVEDFDQERKPFRV
jgi:hypothetical protein